MTEFPLFCVDCGPDHDEERYRGPFPTSDAAQQDAQQFWTDEHHVEKYGLEHPFEIRRCRRAKPSELPFARRFFDWLVETMEEDASDDPPAGECWARWNDAVLHVEKETARFVEGGFWAWADLCLRVDIFIMEPAEEKHGDDDRVDRR